MSGPRECRHDEKRMHFEPGIARASQKQRDSSSLQGLKNSGPKSANFPAIG